MYVIPYVLTSYLVPCCRSLAVAGPARIASIVITELLRDLQFGTILTGWEIWNTNLLKVLRRTKLGFHLCVCQRDYLFVDNAYMLLINIIFLYQIYN